MKKINSKFAESAKSIIESDLEHEITIEVLGLFHDFIIDSCKSKSDLAGVLAGVHYTKQKYLLLKIGSNNKRDKNIAGYKYEMCKMYYNEVQLAIGLLFNEDK
jgi:hypothetical protein